MESGHRRCCRRRQWQARQEEEEATAESAGEPMADVEWRPEDLEFPDRGGEGGMEVVGFVD